MYRSDLKHATLMTIEKRIGADCSYIIGTKKGLSFGCFELSHFMRMHITVFADISLLIIAAKA